MRKNQLTSLDYFSGGVPACAIFSMNSKSIRTFLNTKPRGFAAQDSKYELCLIGLVSYFEAYFKDHFASLINIYPKLLFNLKDKNYDVNVDICDIIEYEDNSRNKFYGFIIAERFDFGTPSKINSLYQALINVSPFSTDEKLKYEEILNDRNLIVHHGGIYTSKYLKQKMKHTLFKERVFMDSIVLNKSDIISVIDFSETIVKKVSEITQKRIKEIIQKEKIKSNSLINGAIKMLNMW